jgi:hypothetical protein
MFTFWTHKYSRSDHASDNNGTSVEQRYTLFQLNARCGDRQKYIIAGRHHRKLFDTLASQNVRAVGVIVCLKKSFWLLGML